MGKFNGQVVLITGASSGIGAALAREFARESAHTILLARSADRIEALARELTREGIRSLAVAGDVTRDGDLERAVERARSEFGRLDVAVANAGFSVKGALRSLRWMTIAGSGRRMCSASYEHCTPLCPSWEKAGNASC